MNPFESRPFSQDDLKKIIDQTRRTTIDECARAIEGKYFKHINDVAAAIRALKGGGSGGSANEVIEEDQSEIDIDYLLQGGL